MCWAGGIHSASELLLHDKETGILVFPQFMNFKKSVCGVRVKIHILNEYNKIHFLAVLG